MRRVKKIPKSAICFEKNESFAFYVTKNCAYMEFRKVGKFIKGKFVIIPNVRTIYRFNSEQLEEFMSEIGKIISYLDLIDGLKQIRQLQLEYVNQYIT